MAEQESNRNLPVGTEGQAQIPVSSDHIPLKATSESARSRAYSIGVCMLFFVVVALVFLPTTRNEFLSFDDGAFVTANPQVQSGLSWKSLIWALRNPVAANWHPVTVLSHMLDCQLYGLKPWGHHLTNVLIHALNTVLVFLVFRRMTGAFWRCVVLAALFGLHPLRVESVAWVAERKDVLSSLFFLLALWAYASYVEAKRESRNEKAEMETPSSVLPPPASELKPPLSCHLPSSIFYFLSLACFVLGLMSKPMLVTLPFVLLLLDYWPLQRFGFKIQDSRFKTFLRLVSEKLPFFVLAAVCSVVTCLLQRTAGAMATDLPLELRLANTPISYVRYLGKTFWPANLAIFYPHPFWWPTWQVIASATLLLVILAVVILLARRWPYLALGWLWFCGTLVPVIGLVQVGNQSIADRYTYLPSIGLFVLLVWGAYDVTVRWRDRTAFQSAAAVVVTILCLVWTRQQIGYWRDDESLWGHAVTATENNGFAHLKLGTTLAGKGRVDEAIGHFESAIRLSPRDDRAYGKLAFAFAEKHLLAEAVQQYEAALRLNPGDAGFHNDLGLTLARQGRIDEAIQHYTEALRLKPDFAEVHYNLGLALASRGHYREAAVHFQKVLQLKPEDPKARQKLEGTLATQQQLEQATAAYREALRINPGDARARADLGWELLNFGQRDEGIENCIEAARLEPNNTKIQHHLGMALARNGEAEKAIRQFERVLELDPNFGAAHYTLGIICQQQRRMSEALKHWREAARVSPQWPDPLNSLAWTLATDPHAELRDGTEAVKLASRAVELSDTNNVRFLDTLAAAYAEAGRFVEAISTACKARAAAVAQGQADWAEQIQQRVSLYGSYRPYRQEPEANSDSP